jgi:hypothetical protein
MNFNKILLLETTVATLKALANDGTDLAKDNDTMPDGGTVKTRFTAAALALELPCLQILDAAGIPAKESPTPAAAEAAEVAKALEIPTDTPKFDANTGTAAVITPPAPVSAPAAVKPAAHAGPHLNPLSGRYE